MSLKRLLTYMECVDLLEKNFHKAKDLYITQDKTARQVAGELGIIHNKAFQKACMAVFGLKGKGLGGARVGAGNFRDKREERRKMKDYTAISINLSPEAMKILKESGGSYAYYISRAIFFYNKAMKAIGSPEKS